MWINKKAGILHPSLNCELLFFMIPPNRTTPSDVSKSILTSFGADSGSSPETYNRANHQNQQVGSVSKKAIHQTSC